MSLYLLNSVFLYEANSRVNYFKTWKDADKFTVESLFVEKFFIKTFNWLPVLWAILFKANLSIEIKVREECRKIQDNLIAFNHHRWVMELREISLKPKKSVRLLTIAMNMSPDEYLVICLDDDLPDLFRQFWWLKWATPG